MPTLTAADVRSALRGDKAAVHALLTEIGPVVEARSLRVMARLGSRARAFGHEHRDLVQESFARLFAHDGKALLQWNPERGMSLRNWVGMIVERALLTILHAKGVSLELSADLDVHDLTREDPVAILEFRSVLACLAAHIGSALPARRLALFSQLCVQREEIADVASDTGISAKALYAARARMEKLAKGFVEGPA